VGTAREGAHQDPQQSVQLFALPVIEGGREPGFPFRLGADRAIPDLEPEDRCRTMDEDVTGRQLPATPWEVEAERRREVLRADAPGSRRGFLPSAQVCSMRSGERYPRRPLGIRLAR
jgi:hypothetical protein